MLRNWLAYCLLSVFLLVCVDSVLSVQENFTPSIGKRVAVSVDFTKALDVAMANVITSAKWQNIFESLGIPFNVPKCTSKFGSSYPPNPFPSSKTMLNICYEEPAQVWSSIFVGAGDLLAETLNAQYKINLKANHRILNTTEWGYFSSMKAGVDSGECDVVTSNVIRTTARAEQVHMNCPYGSSSLAFLRSEFNSTKFNTTAQLNSSDAIIVVYQGTYFETIARSLFPAAQLILEPGGYDATYEYIKDGAPVRAHATIADAVDLSFWLTNNRAKCVNCNVKLFGDAYEYGSVTSKLFDSDGGISIKMMMMNCSTIVMMILLLSLLL